MQNRYVVHLGAEDGPVVGFAEQKRLAFKEQVTIYADEGKGRVLAGFKARRVIDLGSGYDVVDGDGRPIGLFRKDFGASLLRSTWHVEQPGRPTVSGQERSVPVAVLRRFVESLSWLPYHFDFTVGGNAPVFSVEKKWGIRDRYRVTIEDPDVDRRLVICLAVAVDALQAR
ncbi:MAG TPA: hypothetical protein VGD67_11705 [Pseudonocardiaceae bacterium]